jgi:hypothetical protein
MKQVEIWLKGMLAAAIRWGGRRSAHGIGCGRLAFGRRIVSTARASHKLYYVN